MTNKHNEFDEVLAKKDNEIKETLEKITLLQQELENTKTSHEEKVLEMSSEVENLQHELDDLVEYKTANEIFVYALTLERDDAVSKLEEITNIKNKVEEELQEKNTELSNVKNQMQEIESNKDHEINRLKEELEATGQKFSTEIGILKMRIDEKSQYGDAQKSESENLYQEIITLTTKINEKDKNIAESNTKLDEITSELEKLKTEHENIKKDTKYEITILENKLQNVTDSKDEIINNLKSMVSEKDSQVISLTVESTKLSEEVARLTDLLEESQAELEIGKNELYTLNEEHENIVITNETNISMKNKELRSLHDEIKELKQMKIDLEHERDKNNQYVSEKQVCKRNICVLWRPRF